MFFMSSMLGYFHVLWFAFGHCHFGGISCHLRSIEFSHRFGLACKYCDLAKGESLFVRGISWKPLLRDWQCAGLGKMQKVKKGAGCAFFFLNGWNNQHFYQLLLMAHCILLPVQAVLLFHIFSLVDCKPGYSSKPSSPYNYIYFPRNVIALHQSHQDFIYYHP